MFVYIYIYTYIHIYIYIYIHWLYIYIYIQAFLGGLDVVDPPTGAAIHLRGGQGVHQHLRERVRRPKVCEGLRRLWSCVQLLGTEVGNNRVAPSLKKYYSYFGEGKEVYVEPPLLIHPIAQALHLGCWEPWSFRPKSRFWPGNQRILRFSIKLLPFPGGEEDRCVSAREKRAWNFGSCRRTMWRWLFMWPTQRPGSMRNVWDVGSMGRLL